MEGIRCVIMGLFVWNCVQGKFVTALKRNLFLAVTHQEAVYIAYCMLVVSFDIVYEVLSDVFWYMKSEVFLFLFPGHDVKREEM